MNYTFQRVAAFCGLRLSYYITAALLALSFLLLILMGYRTASPIYILLVMAVLPSFFKTVFFSKQKEEKRENALAFPLFCEKYRYNSASYNAMNLAYLILFIFLAAWHISYHNATGYPAIIPHLPGLVALVSLSSRILAFIGYRLYFRLFPMKAMR